jgi:hypothetical protein
MDAIKHESRYPEPSLASSENSRKKLMQKIDVNKHPSTPCEVEFHETLSTSMFYTSIGRGGTSVHESPTSASTSQIFANSSHTSIRK